MKIKNPSMEESVKKNRATKPSNSFLPLGFVVVRAPKVMNASERRSQGFGNFFHKYSFLGDIRF